MNNINNIYEIRIAFKSEIDIIMSFIKKEWNENHILANNKDFFEYEFLNGEYVNFVIALHRINGSLDGIIGFNPASKDKEHLDIWGVMWKVKDNLEVPFLGIELMKQLIKLTKCRTEIGVGANLKTSIPLLKLMLGFRIDKMDHYYYLSNREKYIIAIIVEKKKNRMIKDTKVSICDIHTRKDMNNAKEIFENKKVIPYKDIDYIEKRFLRHPIYQYIVKGILNSDGKIGAILIMREVEYNSTKVLRIVDYIGEHYLFSKLANIFQKMIEDYNYEYIDFYTKGMKEEYILNAGFQKHTEDDLNIIPNYFEPLVQENIDIWVNSSSNEGIFFKADGDQDRPNKIV